MTVKELIKLLRKYHDNCVVVVEEESGMWDFIGGVKGADGIVSILAGHTGEVSDDGTEDS